MKPLKTELQQLYGDASKHSAYQNIPDFVSAELGYTETIDESWRGDRPRLTYLYEARKPAAGEIWMDFGANTGFFTLSLAKTHPQTRFIAVEANPNHAAFIRRVADYFQMGNVGVIQSAVGIEDLPSLPKVDFMLHLNVLHHAGHDFDKHAVACIEDFGEYAQRYLKLLRGVARGLFFQMGSNWGGDKSRPLVGLYEDAEKLRLFATWLRYAGWRPVKAAYPHRGGDGRIAYHDLATLACAQLAENSGMALEMHSWESLDQFPGEFYRRPLFICEHA